MTLAVYWDVKHQIKQKKKQLLYTCMTVVQCALMHVLFVEIKKNELRM